MAEPISNSESSTSKRKAEQEEQDSNPIQNPSLSQLQKPNLPDTPTSTSSNRVSSSNDNKTNDAESPTANKKSKNNPIVELDRYNKLKFVSDQEALPRGLAFSRASTDIQLYVLGSEGIISEIPEAHYPYIAFVVQGSEKEAKDLAKEICEKACDDSAMEGSQTEELKPSEKLSIEVIIKAIEKVASLSNWGLNWEDVDSSVEKGEKIPANHKLSRFQLWTWEINDPSTVLPKLATQISQRTATRSTSRLQTIELFNNLSEEEKTSYLKNKPVAKGAAGKTPKNGKNGKGQDKDGKEKASEKKGGEIKESSIPNTPTATARKGILNESSKLDSDSKTPASSQDPKISSSASSSKRKLSSSNTNDAIEIDSSDKEMEEDGEGDISMKSAKSSTSKKGKTSRSTSPSKKDTSASPTKKPRKKKELTEEEKIEKEKKDAEKEVKEREKKRNAAIREEKKEEKRLKEEKVQKAKLQQQGVMASFLGKKVDSPKVGESSSKGNASRSTSPEKTPSSSASKLKIPESAFKKPSADDGRTDFERAFSIIPSRHNVAEHNRFAKGKEATPTDELFDQDIPTSELFSQFKARNPNKSSTSICRHKTIPRLCVKEVMELVAESDTVGGASAEKAAKGLQDLGNKQMVWNKSLQFAYSRRPAWFGTHTQPSSTVGPCTPFHKDIGIDYTYDSDDAWEDEEVEGADMLDGPDEDAASESGNESADSWLVDDMDVDEEPEVLPLPDDDDDIVPTDARGNILPAQKKLPPKVNSLSAKKKKDPKKAVPLIPFCTGPHFEKAPGVPSYLGFKPFQAEFLNGASFGVNPFKYVAPISTYQPENEEEEESGNTSKGKGKESAEPKRKKPVSVFPEAKMRDLLLKIQGKSCNKVELVKTMLAEFKEFTTKVALERVITESTEKRAKTWIIKPELMTRYNIEEANIFSKSPVKGEKPVKA